MTRLDIPARVVVESDRTLAIIVGGVSLPVSRVSEWQISYLQSAHDHEEARAAHIMSGKPGPGGMYPEGWGAGQ